MTPKKAQIEITFNWVYILVAGALILLFFISLVAKGKVAAEESLEADVLRIMESILVGSGVAEKTKNFIDISGLTDYTLEFKCEEGLTGFGIKGRTLFQEIPLEPIFAPKEIKTSRLILWSLPYQLPYKVMDLLMVTSINTQYLIIGEDDFKTELEKSREGLNFKFEEDFGDLDSVEPGNNFHLRIVDLDGTHLGDSVPRSLQNLTDSRVSAVSFSGPKKKEVTYFQKEGSQWKEINKVDIISIAKEKDAAKYAALFASDAENYQCNMMKVFRRMRYINEVYQGKLKELEDYYALPDTPNREICQLLLTIQPRSAQYLLTSLQDATKSCVLQNYKACSPLAEKAQALKTLNEELAENCLPSLY